MARPKCDSCGKKPLRGGLKGFKLTNEMGGVEYAIVVRLCTRGCAEKLIMYRKAHKTTEPPEIKTQWGGQPLEPLRTGGEHGQ